MTAGFVIFVGPSLPAREAAAIAPFDLRPPAAQGDVFRAVEGGARAIGLIDGLFEGAPAVWHKEILFALSRGVHVFGAASMGALRAAELHTFGMRGIGRIFEWYAWGAIDADDEVALAHAPAEMGHAALTLALVNVRATLEAARAVGAIDAVAARTVLDAARRVHFKQRDWRAVFDAAGLAGDGAVARALAVHAVDLKRADARLLLEAMAALAADWRGPHRPDFAFEPTHAWEAGVATFRAPESLSEHDRLVLDEARLEGERFAAVAARATATLLAAEAGHAPPPAGRGRRVDRFRRERGLIDREAYARWLAQSGLDERALAALLDARAATWALADRRPEALAAAILSEVRLDGSFEELARRAADKARRRAASLPGRRPPRHLLLEWYFEQRLGRSAPDDLDEARRDLALPDVETLFEMIEREYLATGLPNQE